MSSAISGDFVTISANGYDLTGQLDQCSYTHQHASLPLMPYNTGLHQAAPGIFQPQAQLGGFVQHVQGGINPFNLFFPNGALQPGAAQDTEFILMAALGINAPAVAGDYGFIMDATLLPQLARQNDLKALMRFTAQFRARGVRVPLFPVLLMDASQKGSLTTAYYDDGAESIGAAYGAVSCLEVLTPTGTAASGNISITGNAAPSDTVVINGITFTAVATLTGVAGQVLIGSSGVETMQNLWQAIMASPVGAGIKYVAGVTAPATVDYGKPDPTTGQIAITFKETGVAGNSFTLVKTGTAFTVSGATLTGGVAGETATSVTAQSCTTSGGAYTAFATHTLDFTKRKAEIITVAPGIAINQFKKVIITMSGSTMNWAARLMVGIWFAGQM